MGTKTIDNTTFQCYNYIVVRLEACGLQPPYKIWFVDISLKSN